MPWYNCDSEAMLIVCDDRSFAGSVPYPVLCGPASLQHPCSPQALHSNGQNGSVRMNFPPSQNSLSLTVKIGCLFVWYWVAAALEEQPLWRYRRRLMCGGIRCGRNGYAGFMTDPLCYTLCDSLTKKRSYLFLSFIWLQMRQAWRDTPNPFAAQRRGCANLIHVICGKHPPYATVVMWPSH